MVWKFSRFGLSRAAWESASCRTGKSTRGSARTRRLSSSRWNSEGPTPQRSWHAPTLDERSCGKKDVWRLLGTNGEQPCSIKPLGFVARCSSLHAHLPRSMPKSRTSWRVIVSGSEESLALLKQRWVLFCIEYVDLENRGIIISFIVRTRTIRNLGH